MAKQVIILFGPPGAGKGTQAELLSDRLNLYYLETSKILEESFRETGAKRFISVEGKKYDVLEEKKLWSSGVLCSPPFVSFLIKEKIKELHKEGKSLVLAGSPRTLLEGKEVLPVLKKYYGKGNIKVIFIELSPKETIFRNSRRRICELMRHPILYAKDTARLKICPLDGSKLIRRKNLDDPETIKVRIKEYKERTFPLLEYFRKQGVSVKKIKGEQSVANVFRDILKAVE